MDWDKLRVFHAVAEAGSFTHAGELLNLSQSAVSRQISALEESLKVPLFHRHARGLILTEQGEVLHGTARDIFAKLSMTEALLTESKDKPKGPLKVTTTFAFGSTWLVPSMQEFLSLYPDVQLTFLIDDHELDLAMREADVAIRMQPPRQPDLVQRHLLSIGFHIYGSTDYLAQHGIPQTADELQNHMLIAYPPTGHAPFPTPSWLLDVAGVDGRNHPRVFQVNNMYAIFRAVQSGLGLAALPDYMVHGRPNLVRVLPEVSAPEVEAFFVYAEELRHSKRISVFRDFLVRKVAESAF